MILMGVHFDGDGDGGDGDCGYGDSGDDDGGDENGGDGDCLSRILLSQSPNSGVILPPLLPLNLHDSIYCDYHGKEMVTLKLDMLGHTIQFLSS